jgi:hypothetical protein
MKKEKKIRKVKTLTFKQWLKEGEKLFGADREKWEFICPNCKEVQTLQDFINNGVKDPSGMFYFSCIGREVEGRGCDWSLGGLFTIHKTEVISDDGEKVPVMEFNKQIKKIK